MLRGILEFEPLEASELAIATVIFHLDTLADRLLDSVLHFVPAEILIVIVVFLVGMGLLLYLTDKLPSRSNGGFGVEEPAEPTTRPPRTKSNKQ